MRIVQKFISGNMNDLIKSPVGTAESAPQVLFIIFDSMFLQNRQIFFLKGLLLMMIFLVFDVIYRVVDMGNANTKCAISLLPLKILEFRERFTYPR